MGNNAKERMQYILDLDPSEVRFHVHHFWGDHYFFYEQGRDKTLMEKRWKEAIKDLPEKYIISEPQPSFGYILDGRMFNYNTILYQRAVKHFYELGILAKLESMFVPQILEIGSGWGQFALHLKAILPSARFCLIDLPMPTEMAMKYLYFHLKEKLNGITLYTSEEYPEQFHPQYDFVISDTAFHEMDADSLVGYARFIEKHLNGSFYCRSGDRSPTNPDGLSVSDVLSVYFKVKAEIPDFASKKNPWDRVLDLNLRKLGSLVAGRKEPKYDSFQRVYTKR